MHDPAYKMYASVTSKLGKNGCCYSNQKSNLRNGDPFNWSYDGSEEVNKGNQAFDGCVVPKDQNKTSQSAVISSNWL